MKLPAKLLSLILPIKLSPSAKLGPEDKISIDFATRLRMWTINGDLRAVWWHTANEVGGGRDKSSQIAYSVASNLGAIAGAPDFILIREGFVFLIEMKTKTGTITARQHLFAEWCEWASVRYAVCRSADEAERLMRESGFLR